MCKLSRQLQISRFSLILASLSFSFVSGQPLRDTSLISLMSRPFFYNVVKDRKGVVYAGTTEGVYRMEEATPVRVDGRKGYLKIDGEGRVAIDSNGIRFHKQSGMSHLLPFPNEEKNEYHAGGEEYFYITAGGRMHVYEVRPYGRRFRNHSIRTISKNFTGTYSGIYYHNQLLKPPVSGFTDGYIREWNGKVFMCTHGLDVFDLKELENGADAPRMLPLAGDVNFVPSRDIRYLDYARKYLVASGNRLILLDSSLQQASVLFTGTGNDEVLLFNENRTYGTMLFSQGNRTYTYQANLNKIVPSSVIDQTIMDADIREERGILLTSDALLLERGGRIERKAEGIELAHTLRAISEMEYVIATDRGLFLYNIPDDRLSTLVPQVEFNRRALHIQDGRLYAGSIDGLYILDLSNLSNIVAFHARKFETAGRPAIPAWLIGVLVILMGGIGWTNYHYRRRIRRMEMEKAHTEKPATQPRLSREEIEAFIRDNLPNASLKTIIDHFRTNNSMVYSMLAPMRPGELIQSLRQERLRSMRNDGRKPAEIAEATGLSESYIRKIWKKDL
jgi:hypothetical protein